jgi:hypothetical protein
MSRQKLAEYDAQYKKIRRGWEQARDQIISSTRAAGFDSYQIVNESVGDELRIMVCGALAYIRFKHDLTHGFLEYGVLKMHADGEHEERIKIEVFQFDTLGNVAQHWSLKPGSGSEFSELHLRTLAEKTSDILWLFFDLAELQSEEDS